MDHPPRGYHPRPGKAVGSLFARLLFLFRRLLAPGGRRVARHPGLRATAGQPGFQALYPLPHLGNGVLLFRDDSPLFRDNRQQGFPARLLQVQFRSHCSFMPQLRSNRQCFHQDSGLRQIHLINSELLHNCGIA